jgi:hypothetical protein
MKLDVQPPIVEASSSPEKRIVALSWSPDSERLAIATTGRTVTLYRASDGSISKIPAKARDDSSNSTFTITSLAWAPDSCSFVSSQSDMIVAVYEVGAAKATDSQKKITLRLSAKSPILCIAWPVASPSAFVFGASDGTVMCGLTKIRKAEEPYRHSALPLTMASALRENAVAVEHLDGAVFVVNLSRRWKNECSNATARLQRCGQNCRGLAGVRIGFGGACRVYGAS